MTLKGRVKDEEAKNYETVVFWKQLKFKNDEDEEKSFPMIRYTRVYNFGQCIFDEATIKKLVPETEENPFTPKETCENIVKGYKDCPEINFGGGRAFYSPLMDRIQMPLKESFTGEEEYYSTLFHEMGHSTGSERRLKRFKSVDSGIFGSETYSKEELIAEMVASFLSAESGIENNTIENSASYIAGWLKAIKNADKTFVVQAASRASFASNYILGRVQRPE
jgi:antirestriction protein ArdC